MNASLLVKPLDIEIHLNLDTAMVVKITSIGGQNYLTTALQKQLQSNRIHLYRTSVKSFVKIREIISYAWIPMMSPESESNSGGLSSIFDIFWYFLKKFMIQLFLLIIRFWSEYCENDKNVIALYPDNMCHVSH